MTTPTGTITMADVNVELGLSSSATISLNDTNVRLLAGVPSGTISMNNLRGKSAGASYIAVAHATSPRISVYTWSNSGFGTKFSNPTTVPPSTPYSVSVNTGPYSSTPATVIATYGLSSSPYVSVYAWSSSGFGTKYADPSGWPTAAGAVQNNAMSFSPDGGTIAFGLTTNSPYIAAYPFSGGFGTRYANPATLPNSFINVVNWSRNSNAILLAGSSTGASGYPIPYYNFSGGFGSFTVGPYIPFQAYGITQHPTEDVVVSVHTTSSVSNVRAYNWTSGGGYGSGIANPSPVPTGTARQSAFTRTGTVLGHALSGSPYIRAFPWTGGGFGSVYANPAVLPSADPAVGFSWSGNSNACAVVNDISPYIDAYAFSGGFGTKYSNPGTAIAGSGEAVRFFG